MVTGTSACRAGVEVRPPSEEQRDPVGSATALPGAQAKSPVTIRLLSRTFCTVPPGLRMPPRPLTQQRTRKKDVECSLQVNAGRANRPGPVLNTAAPCRSKAAQLQGKRHPGPTEEGSGAHTEARPDPSLAETLEWVRAMGHRLHRPDCGPDRALYLGKLLAPLDP